jgi:hypothetical protein
METDNLFDNLEPFITKKLHENYINTPYDEYLCDFLLTKFDPHSVFYYSDEQEYKNHGINYLQFRRDPSTNLQLVEASYQSNQTGIFKGDTVLEINGIPTSFTPNGLFINLLNKDNSTITIKRGNSYKIKPILYLKQNNDYGFLIDTLGSDYYLCKFYHINKNLASDFYESIIAFNDTSRKLILDFSSCPGGIFFEALRFVDLFVDSGSVILHLKENFRIFQYDNIFYSKQPIRIKNEIHAILTSPITASGSEVIIGNLLYYDLTKNVIGLRTCGSGNLQRREAFVTSPNCFMRLTFGFMCYPDKEIIEGNGIDPIIVTNDFSRENILNILDVN